MALSAGTTGSANVFGIVNVVVPEPGHDRAQVIPDYGKMPSSM